MQQAAVQQFRNQHPHAAGGLEMVDVRRPVGIDLGDQRDGPRQFVEVVPVEGNPRGAGDGDRDAWCGW